MQELSRENHTMVFVDASPSELIHNLLDKILVFSVINYYNIEFDRVRISQFKNTRQLDRKLKTQDFIIDCFEKKLIVGTGSIAWNSQKLAIYNAEIFLKAEELLPKEQQSITDRIDIQDYNLSIGHYLSLAWYAINLARNAGFIAQVTRVENKWRAAILLDLLSGDNINSTRNLDIIRYIINNSKVLFGLMDDASKKFKLQAIGFGYGALNNSTKELKQSPPFAVTDWITQSFYCKLKCEKIVKDEHYESNQQFTKLADYLIQQKIFLIAKPFEFTW